MRQTKETKRNLPGGWSIFYYILLLFAISCTQAEVMDDDSQEQTGEVEAAFDLRIMAGTTPVSRSFTMTANGFTVADTLTQIALDSLKTRAGTDKEQAINNVWVGQYDDSGNLMSCDYITSILADNQVIIKLKPSPMVACHIWFVTNADDLSTIPAIQTESGLKEHRLSCVTATGGLEGDACTMTGMWSGIVPKTGISVDKANAVSLTRLMAKITFHYVITTTPGFSFVPTSVKLVNVPDKSQIETPVSPLSTPLIYSGETGSSGTTMSWYLPENMAGNGDAVSSLKERIAEGVKSPATYIELAGDAVQGGVSYSNVAIRFYPGDKNKLDNYDIERNGHYTMDIALGGLDLSDKRITIGDIPEIQNPGNLPAAKGETAEVQITARQGQKWMLDLPLWLSATIEGKTQSASPGSILSYQGPCKVTFKTEESNPKAEIRSIDFPIAVEEGKPEQTLTLTQDASVLNVPATPVRIGAVPGSVADFSFTATAGLQWDAILGADWLEWNGGVDPALDNNGWKETTTMPQTCTIVAGSVNPSKNVRKGLIMVRAGASIGDPDYAGLRNNIIVEQDGSVVNNNSVAVVAAPVAGTVTFSATPGLPWTATSDVPWITVNTPGGESTVAVDNAVSFNTTELNPNGTQRTGTITVTAGERPDSPVGTLAVNQAASEFSVVNPKVLIPRLGGSVTGTVTTSPGLRWTITPDVSNKMTVSPVSGIGTTELTFETSYVNNDYNRIESFTVSVTGASSLRTAKIKVTQAGFPKATINQAAVNSYKLRTTNYTAYPPFDKEGSDFRGISSTCTLTKEYSIEVEMTEYRHNEAVPYSEARNYCNNKGGGWRLPTMIELKAMYDNRAALQAIPGFVPFIAASYWTYGYYNRTSSQRCLIQFSPAGIFTYTGISGGQPIRCVRDLPVN